jgi:hypothetical protein
MRKIFVLCSVLSFAFSACSLKKTAEDMQSTTQKISDRSEHLSKRTDDLEGDAVKRATNETMNENFAILFGKNESLLSRHATDEEMTRAAGTVVESLFYQFWRGDYGDDILELDERGVVSLLPFLTELKGHIPSDYNVNPLVPHRTFRALGILSNELDRTIPEFDRVTAARGLPRLSVYNLMVEALKNRGAVERKEVMPQTTAQILLFEPQVVYMLQLRHNFLFTKVLCFLTNLTHTDIFGKLDMLLWNAVLGTHHDLAKFNNAQLAEWTAWLKASAETRRALEDLGVQPIDNWQLKTIFNGQHFNGEAELLQNKSARMDGRQKTEVDFLEAVQAVKQPVSR